MKKLTKTEKVMYFLDSVALILTILTICLFIFTEKDVTPIEILAGAWIAEAAHFHQVYAKKEGMANKQKHALAWWKEVIENQDIPVERLEAARGMTSVVTE